ncbi:hypothetical protein IFO70_22275 [Phormidium tenue FACHB-886]|nr:hypothetical protein [Phormidium tenue FACHB-886]
MTASDGKSTAAAKSIVIVPENSSATADQTATVKVSPGSSYSSSSASVSCSQEMP